MREIQLSHGGGGVEMNQLINQLFFRHFGNEILLRGEDAALLPVNGPVAFTTDSFTVSPLFFEGRYRQAGHRRYGQRSAMMGPSPSI